MRLKAIVELQDAYKWASVNSETATSTRYVHAMQFADRWEITYEQALAIAKGQMSLSDAAQLMCNHADMLIADVEALHRVAPMPWKLDVHDISGFLEDITGSTLCGGEYSEGYIDADEPWVSPMLELTNTYSKLREVLK